MLSADAALEFRPLGPSGLDTVLDELADTLGVDGLERICIQELVAEIFAHEGAHVVT